MRWRSCATKNCTGTAMPPGMIIARALAFYGAPGASALRGRGDDAVAWIRAWH
jgi:hypothetical protein